MATYGSGPSGPAVSVLAVPGQPALLRLELPAGLNVPYPEVRAALVALFEATKIDSDFVLDEPDERVFPASLDEFLRQYVAYAGRKKASYESEVKRAEELAETIMREYRVDFYQMPDEEARPLAERIELYEKFLEVAPKLQRKDLLVGQAITFFAPFSGTYYDRQERVLCLEASADPLQWASYIDLKLGAPDVAPFLRDPAKSDKDKDPARFLERMRRINKKNAGIGGLARQRENKDRAQVERQEQQLCVQLHPLPFPRSAR